MLEDEECPPSHEPTVKKRALIERFHDYKDELCLFVHNFSVPFDNNQAKRDVHNIKTKVKVAECFHSSNGADDYPRIMSYLGTGRKHGVDPFTVLTAAFRSQSNIVLERS